MYSCHAGVIQKEILHWNWSALQGFVTNLQLQIYFLDMLGLFKVSERKSDFNEHDLRDFSYTNHGRNFHNHYVPNPKKNEVILFAA